MLKFVLSIFLYGCQYNPTQNTSIWVVCYKDDLQHPDGSFINNELTLKCTNKSNRNMIHFSTRIDSELNNNSDRLKLQKRMEDLRYGTDNK